MGYMLPGGRFSRYGDSLLDADTRSTLASVPHTKPVRGHSLGGTQKRIASARSVTAAADISRTAPTFNDPRYTFTTLSIPTDLRTLNGLYRFFDDTDPLVGNAIRLHCEFPLSRVSMKDVSDPVIQRHYEDMWDRIQVDKLLFDIGLEYWRIGNVFPYGAWNVDDMMWEQFVILNPDYVTVEGTYLNQRPFIKLQPDEHLKKIVTTGQPKFLYDQLPPEIVKYVRMGQEIPLSPQNVFHVAHNKSPYETLGRSIIKRILKSLIYEDRMSMANFAIATRQTIPITVVKIGDPNSGWVPNDEELAEVQELLSAREVDPNFCYDEKTECLTDQGWIKYTDLTYDHKIASFNPDGNHLEYHKPQAITIQDYDDDMIHFKTRKIDCKVTPNHRMWVKRDNKWQVIFAQDVIETDILRTTVDSYDHSDLTDTLLIEDTRVGTGDFFEYIGWYISEGSISSYGHSDKNYGINITQTEQGSFEDVEKLMEILPWDYKVYQECQFNINDKKLGDYIVSNFGRGSNKKKLPSWVLSASPEYLERLFTAYIKGDGTTIKTNRGEFYQAYTASKELANNLQEIGIKLGYSVSLKEHQPKSYKDVKTGKIKYKKVDGSDFFLLYRLNFSKDSISKFPSLKRRKDYKPVEDIQPTISRVPYKGKIWCVSVPPGIIVTRRNGCPMVAGQTIIYHWGIDIQFYGASGKIWNLTNEFNRIMKWKMLGLGISEAILTGGSSYATAYAQLEVLRQRYLHFQHAMQTFVYRGIFEPVAYACGFYKTEDVVAGRYYSGQKYGNPVDSKDMPETDILSKHASDFNNAENDDYVTHVRAKQAASNISGKQLVYPGLDWDLLSLSNDVQYRNFLMNFDRLFPGQRKISDETFYQAAKIDRDTERDKLAKEHAENLNDQLETARVDQEYREKFAEEGLPFPADKAAAPDGGAGGAAGAGASGAPGTTPGPGGMALQPGQAPPPGGGTGGGNIPGGPNPPNAPVGQNNFTGADGGKTPGVPRNPAASRLRSMDLHNVLTRSSIDIDMEEDLAEEVKQLRLANIEAGVDMDKVDDELKSSIESNEDSPDPKVSS